MSTSTVVYFALKSNLDMPESRAVFTAVSDGYIHVCECSPYEGFLRAYFQLNLAAGGFSILRLLWGAFPAC